MTNMSAAEIVARVRRGAALGLNQAAHHVQSVAVPNTPIEYGDLRSSLVVSEATPDSLEASVSSDLPYAVRQHEELGYRHREGGPKFLENAALGEQDMVGKIVQANVRRAVEG